MTDATIPARLREHAHGLLNGGTNASELVSDLREAADRLEPIEAHTVDRSELIAVRVVRWARENDIHCTLGQLNALVEAVCAEITASILRRGLREAAADALRPHPQTVEAFIRSVRDEAIRLSRTYKHLSSAAVLQEAFDRRAGEHLAALRDPSHPQGQD